MTLASSPTRMSAVMIASRTRGTCSTPSAVASAGTASTRPPSARAALHLTSISRLPNAAICGARSACGARSSAGRPPVDAGAVTSRLTKGICTHQSDDRPGDLFDRPHLLGSSISYEFAGHAPDNGARLRLRDGSPALLAQPRHRICPVAPHPGHQHSNQLRGVVLLKRAGYHSFHSWMPWIVALRRHGHGDHARRSRRDDQVGVAAPDIDVACLQRHRTAHFDHLKLALTIEPFGKRTG